MTTETNQAHSLAQITEFKRLASSTEPIPERGGGLRDLQGIRISMGGLRLPKPVVVRAEDRFEVGDLKIEPEELVSLFIGMSGKATPWSGEGFLTYPMMVGFRLPRNLAMAGTPLRLSGSAMHASTYLLGDVSDAIIEDETNDQDFVWVVLEPVVIPPPRRFPTAYPRS